MKMKGLSLSLALLASLSTAAAAQDSKPQLPPPEATDPVALGIMKGFPPPADKVVTLANILKFPNGRWAYHHLRELWRPANTGRGAQGPAVLQAKLRPPEPPAFADDNDQQIPVAAWQKNTYTDALLVLHKAKIAYEKYHIGLKAEQPHVLWSMTKSFTG